MAEENRREILKASARLDRKQQLDKLIPEKENEINSVQTKITELEKSLAALESSKKSEEKQIIVKKDHLGGSKAEISIS